MKGWFCMMSRSAFYSELTARHTGILTQAEQEKLAEALIAVAGTGGTGGNVAVSLARLGCCRFRLADNGTFDASNANRQAGCNSQTVGHNKAEVVAKEILLINPDARVEVHCDAITESNAGDFVRGAAVVIDGIDMGSLPAKKGLFDASRRAGIAVVSSPVLGFGTALAVFDPVRSPSFEEYFGPLPDPRNAEAEKAFVRRFGLGFFNFWPHLNRGLYLKRVDEGKVPSVAAACLLSAALSTAAVVDRVLGRNEFDPAPTTIHLDAMDRKMRKLGRLGRGVLRLGAGLLLKGT
jgi:molybdopterin/thiamine biosynthesis adenylyltransferase